jgi:hypothetical protein
LAEEARSILQSKDVLVARTSRKRVAVDLPQPVDASAVVSKRMRSVDVAANADSAAVDSKKVRPVGKALNSSSSCADNTNSSSSSSSSCADGVCSVASASAGNGGPVDVTILFTGIQGEPKLVSKIPGAALVEDATRAPLVVVVGPELKRTPKLMTAINSGSAAVVHVNWLHDCASAGKYIDPFSNAKGAAPGTNYIVRDQAKETEWGFNMQQLLRSCALNAQVTRRPGVYRSCAVLVVGEGVCGSTAPPETDMRAIVESGEGVWIPPAPLGSTAASIKKFVAHVNQYCSTNEPCTLILVSNDAQAERTIKVLESAAGKILLDLVRHVSPVPAPQTRTQKAKKTDTLDRCTPVRIYSTELLFRAVFTRTLNFADYIIAELD